MELHLGLVCITTQERGNEDGVIPGKSAASAKPPRNDNNRMCIHASFVFIVCGAMMIGRG